MYTPAKKSCKMVSARSNRVAQARKKAKEVVVSRGFHGRKQDEIIFVETRFASPDLRRAAIPGGILLSRSEAFHLLHMLGNTLGLKVTTLLIERSENKTAEDALYDAMLQEARNLANRYKRDGLSLYGALLDRGADPKVATRACDAALSDDYEEIQFLDEYVEELYEEIKECLRPLYGFVGGPES